MRKIIGYGICGPGEANRYMKATLEEFKRLCDVVVILCNNATKAEEELIKSYGFTCISDKREWGKWQWKIKQDFIERDIKQIANPGDVLVCLDMDEVFTPKLTKEWLDTAPLDAYHVFIVDLWNDERHYKAQSCFWNVRIWRWNGETAFRNKPVHCGLAPEWTYLYHRHAPFVLLHYGLMKEEDRRRKIERYEKYDPNREHMKSLGAHYYDMLKSNTATPLNLPALESQIEKEVSSYKQRKPQASMASKKKRYAFVKNPHGITFDIPEAHLAETLKRKGFEFVGWSDDMDKEMNDMFGDVAVDDRGGSYQPNVHGHGPEKEYVPSTDEVAAEAAVEDVDTGVPDDDIDFLKDGDDAPPSPTEDAPESPKKAVKGTKAVGKGSGKKKK